MKTLSKEYKEIIMEKLDKMTAQEFVSAFLALGSKRVDLQSKLDKGDYHFNQYLESLGIINKC